MGTDVSPASLANRTRCAAPVTAVAAVAVTACTMQSYTCRQCDSSTPWSSNDDHCLLWRCSTDGFARDPNVYGGRRWPDLQSPLEHGGQPSTRTWRGAAKSGEQAAQKVPTREAVIRRARAESGQCRCCSELPVAWAHSTEQYHALQSRARALCERAAAAHHPALARRAQGSWALPESWRAAG